MEASEATILVVDDVPDTVEVIRRNLERSGYRVLTAGSVAEAMEVLESSPVDLVITDYKMPRTSGMDLVRHVRENHADTEVMMITGFASVAGAVDAVKLGAQEYLPKPFTDEELVAAVDRALNILERRRLAGEPPAADEPATEEPLRDFGIVGRSPAMARLYREIARAAAAPVTVLVTGETGTGKELVARAVHYTGTRSTGPFVPVNCGGIPEGLLERELFGHVKGAFTGATETRAGFLQTAHGGTLFLDEISETSTAMQVKLLRVLQEREICLIGDTRPVPLDIRVIAATNKDLASLVEQGKFREDLYFRLAVVSLEVPPLRQRGEDVLRLAQHFLAKFGEDFGRTSLRFSDAALRALQDYDWPGNVREIENLVQRALVMSQDDVVDVSDLPSPMRFSVAAHPPVHRTIREVEQSHIKRVLQETGGNKSEAARILGISRKTLRDKLSAE